MAKKTLTPEQAEIKAMKKAKSSQNWTKFWAIVLAGALAFGIVAMGQNQAKVALENATANSGEIADDNNDVIDDSDDVVFDDNTSSDNTSNDNVSNDNTSNDNAANNDSSNNNNTSDNAGNNNQQSAQVSNADVAKALNDATAKASKASYKLNRTASFTTNIDVGGLTSILDGIIKGVDENSDLNSVVGGFLGIKKDPISGEVTNGQGGEGFDHRYMLKAMNLTEADIQKAQVNGNTYQVQIKTCENPDNNSSWGHASNDFITFKEVNESIAGAVGSAVKVEESGSKATYKNILIVAVIENGNLTSLKYSYTFDATIKIKAGLTATGTGAAKMECTYSDFKY